MTEEQTEYKTSPQCFGQFERDHVTCKVCGVATECYERGEDKMTKITIMNGNPYVECKECGALELLSVAELCAGLCRECDSTEVNS